MFEHFKHPLYSLLIHPAAACLVSMALTRGCITVLPRLGFIDLPDHRRVHQKATPRGGGIAIILAFFLVSILYIDQFPNDQMIGFITGFSLPASVIIICGLIDDRFTLASRIKLLLQIVAGILVWVSGAKLKFLLGIELPDYLALPLTVLWVVTVINAFNLIDGLDGLAAGLGFISAVCLGFWSGFLNISAFGLVPVSLILAGSCAGFLRYNFSPARIFMGDTGSMFLGLFFAYGGLASFGKQATLTSLLVPVLAIGVPLFDVTLAFWRRLVRKLLEPKAAGIMTADLQHLHHRILNEVHSQRKAAFRIYLLACLLAGMGFVAMIFEHSIPALGYTALLMIVLLVIRRIAGTELYDSARLLQGGLAQPRKLQIVLMGIPAMDLVILIGSYLLSRHLLKFEFSDPWLGFCCLALPILLLFLLSGLYRVLWIRARYKDLQRTGEMILIGLVVGCGPFVLLTDTSDSALLPAFIVLFSLMAATGLCLVRIYLIYVGIRLLWNLRQKTLSEEQKKRVLLYGGGINAALYVNLMLSNSSTENVDIIGIVDDDLALSGTRVFGLPILGCGVDLEKILAKHRVHQLVLTMHDFPPGKEGEIFESAKQFGVTLSRFQMAVLPLEQTKPVVSVDLNDRIEEKSEH